MRISSIVLGLFAVPVFGEASGAWAKCTTTPNKAAPLLGCASQSASAEGAWAKCKTSPNEAAPLLGCASQSAVFCAAGDAPVEPAAKAFAAGDVQELVGELVVNSKRHLDFLKAVHSWAGDELYTASATLACAVKRYKSKWIPLLKEASKNPAIEAVVPPVDVAWIWHVHRLSSLAYDRFAQAHGLDSGAFDGAFQLQANATSNPDEAAEATRALWERLDGDNAFFIDPANLPAECPGVDYLDTSDGVPASSFFTGATDRQGKFLWTYLLPNFDDDTFMRESAERYVRFVRLVGQNPSDPLVPTHPVDLMWHTHILASHTKYATDVVRLGGPEVLGHDDNLPEAELKGGFTTTRKLWHQAFGKTRFKSFPIGDDINGGMSRTPPPPEHWKGALITRPAAPALLRAHVPGLAKAAHVATSVASAAWAKCTSTPKQAAPLLGCASQSASAEGAWAKCTTSPNEAAPLLGCASQSASAESAWAKCTTTPNEAAPLLGCASQSAAAARLECDPSQS